MRGLHQRVVRPVRHRAVAGRALDAEPPPGDALLADVHRDVQLVGPLAAGHRAAVLGEAVVRPEGVPVPLDHMPRAEGAARLLVGAGEVDEGPPRPPPARPAGERLERDRLGGGEVQHVDRAAAPDLAVDQLAAERVARPGLGIDGHDVGVAHQAEGRGLRVGALDAGHQAGAARRVLRRVHLEVQSAALEVAAQGVAVAHLLARQDGAVVHAPVADHLLQELDGLAGQNVSHRRYRRQRSPACRGRGREGVGARAREVTGRARSQRAGGLCQLGCGRVPDTGRVRGPRRTRRGAVVAARRALQRRTATEPPTLATGRVPRRGNSARARAPGGRRRARRPGDPSSSTTSPAPPEAPGRSGGP